MNEIILTEKDIRHNCGVVELEVGELPLTPISILRLAKQSGILDEQVAKIAKAVEGIPTKDYCSDVHEYRRDVLKLLWGE